MSEEKKRKEAIKGLKRLRDDFSGYKPNEEMFDMAIAALSAEPCEDAISRQAALDAFGLSEKTRKYGGDHSGYDTMMLYEIQQKLEDLPSVTPKQRIGHWKQISPARIYECDICGQNVMTDDINAYRYCHGCGAKMIEPQESESV